jgi:dTDP-4-dehydrorhamnose 3,5-epimerase
MHIIQYDKFRDDRGDLYTTWSDRGLDIKFVQDKVSQSVQRTIRGFHGDARTYKLVTCLHGKIKVVTYDLSFFRTESVIIDSSDSTCLAILVHPNTLLAHECLSPECVMHYKWSEYYTSPEDQYTVRYDDPQINARWDTKTPILSDRDRDAKSLKEFLR